MSPDVDRYMLTRDGVCEFRPRGECTLPEFVEMVSEALARCRNEGTTRVLIDGTSLTGVPIPTLVDRFLMVEEWAQVAEGMVVGALVIEPKYIHPQKFGVTVARDHGLIIDVYATEAEAMRWLRDVDVASLDAQP
jgi:hypothetical protein